MIDRTHLLFTELPRRFESAGFYSHADPTWRDVGRVICGGLPGSGGYKLRGRTFWVTTLLDAWFVGYWAGYVYKVSGFDHLVEFGIAWLRRDPRSLPGDFDEDLKNAYKLVPADDEFDVMMDGLN